MKINFLGAAQGVTGSCYILQTGAHRFAVDCGMHQGNAEIEKRNLNMENYRPGELDFILVTHAHIDHIGLLPRVVAGGFKNKIYATSATRDLMQILLLDSAHIQEMESEQQPAPRSAPGRQGRARRRTPLASAGTRSRPRSRLRNAAAARLFEPLYTTADAIATFPHI